MRQLLIHDSRSVGFLTAVVLARLLKRRGNTVTLFSDPAKTRHAQVFWTTSSAIIDLRGIDQVILCCVTFDDVNSDICKGRLEWFKQQTHLPPMILSHRWPDGYEGAGYEVVVPPFDLLELYASELEPAERELLRLSLVISRQADPELVAKEEFDLSERLGTAIWQSPNEFWTKLTEDPSGVLRGLRTNSQIGQSEPLAETARLETVSEKYALFTLDPRVRGHAEKTLQLVLGTLGKRPPLGIGTMNDQGDVRIHLVRPWGANLPSIEYLLERYGNSCGVPKVQYWPGPQDAKSLRFKYAGLNEADLPWVRASLIKFSELAYGVHYGERRPVAGLARAVHLAATEALRSLDLLNAHTKLPGPALRFDPLKTCLLIEPSNRTGELRSTMVLRLLLSTTGAAAFLFKHEGYNLMKLERLLEGALIGMGTQRSIWLESLDIPDRLRVDPQPSDSVIDGLSKAMSESAEVRSVPIEEAVQIGILAQESSIYAALQHFTLGGQGQIIVFRESETIGPSVPYALAVGEVAASLGMAKGGKPVDVLDLFSGSGLSARTVLLKSESWHVYCVDAALTATKAGLGECPNLVWLKTDVKGVLAGEDGILNRTFDIVVMDPPHSALFDILFKPDEDSRTLIDRVCGVTRWLVIYQGHASQIGRAIALDRALRSRFGRVGLWHIGPEVITITGPEKWNEKSFTEIRGRAEDWLRRDCEKYGWTVEYRGD